MVFMQPVAVNDAHALDRTTPAEVRLAEPRAAQDAPTWTGWSATFVAQAGMDSRSPFGPNAVDHNDLTPPGTAPHRPGDTVAPPTGPNAARPTDSSSNTRIPPAGQTDAGPPGASGTTTATPATTPSTGTPGTTPSTATPGVTTPGAGSTSGTTATPPASSTATPGATGATLPGGSSGASNTR